MSRKLRFATVISLLLIGASLALGSPGGAQTDLPPGPFDLLSPARGALDQPHDGILDWTDSEGATSYLVYFGTSAWPPLVAEVTASECPYSGPGDNTRYFWRVVAKAGSRSVPSLSTWYFVTTSPGPPPPALLEPPDGALNQPLSGVLSWEESEGATSYDVYLDDVDPPEFVENVPGTECAYSGLSAARSYYWCIAARNEEGARSSAVRGLSTVPPAPVPSPLVLPPNGATDQPMQVRLLWLARGPANYDVYCDRTNPPSTVVVADTHDTSVVVVLPSGGTYYWKVRSFNYSGEAQSEVWSFTTEAPDPPELVLPEDAAVDQPVAGTLEWQAAARAASYDVYLGSYYPGEFRENVTGLTYDYSGLEPGQYHYWKVVARNGAGLSPSPVREFTTIVAAPDLPELYYPPDGSENVPVEGMVYWYPAARAEGYDVYFGNTNPPPLIGSGTETYYPYSGLANGETYYWQVVATNRGGSTPSAVWSFTTTPVAPSWAEEAVVGGTKVVGAGAALATDQYGNSLYLLKGGGTRELWGFNAWPGGGGWEYLPSIPAKGRDGISRPVKEGGTLVHAGGKLYATKGGRSLDFWEFDLATYGWTQKADVPEGDTGVFSGASAVGYTDPGGWHFVYLLKATGTFEFYRYTVSLDQWDRMPDPPGVPGEEFKEGSALCLGQDSIYALKGGRKAGNFSVYSIGGLWAPFADLPRAGTKNAGAGAALCYHNDTVYCLKGNQTSEFWLYDCGTDEWSPGPEVPVGGAGTTVKNGGAMVYSAYTGLFYATKGQCLEFWSYGPRSGFGRPRGLEAEDDGLQAGQRGADLELMVAPTMFNRAARVSFSLPRAGNVRIGLYDASGRLVRALASGRREAGRYSAGLEAAGLAQGIYVVRFDADGQTFTRTVAIVR